MVNPVVMVSYCGKDEILALKSEDREQFAKAISEVSEYLMDKAGASGPCRMSISSWQGGNIVSIDCHGVGKAYFSDNIPVGDIINKKENSALYNLIEALNNSGYKPESIEWSCNRKEKYDINGNLSDSYYNIPKVELKF